MPISPVEVYFILQLDSFREIINILLVLIAISTVFSTIVFFVSHDDWLHSDERFMGVIKKTCKISLTLFIIFILVRAFLPTTKQMATVILLPQVINNENVQQLPEDILKLVQTLIKEWTTQASNLTRLTDTPEPREPK